MFNLKNEKIEFLFGNKNNFLTKVNKPFDNLQIDFLDSLSKNLIEEKECKKFPDIISFAFWARRKNIERMILRKNDYDKRIGLGAIFHITPANVPINFAYSFAFGLLTGNSNLIKLPSKDFIQPKIFCRILNKTAKQKKFKEFFNKNLFFKYNINDIEITKKFSLFADGRIVWGGDETAKNLRQLKTKPRAKDLFFTDRYSFCILKSKKILSLDKDQYSKFMLDFYNDAYFMDQNACTSPHLIIWTGQKSENNKVKQKFWTELLKIVKKKYLLEFASATHKFLKICEDAINFDHIKKFKNYENLIYKVQLKNLKKNITDLRSKFGYFYEFDCQNLNELKKHITNKFQTLTYYGLDKDMLINFVIKNNLRGIDRIVPVGTAHEISFIWDGYNVDNNLTRIIEVK